MPSGGRSWWLVAGAVLSVVVLVGLVSAGVVRADPVGVCGDLAGDVAGPGGGPANDDYSDAQEIFGQTGTVEGTLTDATIQDGSDPAEVGSDDPDSFDSRHVPVVASRSVWYCFTPPSDGMYYFSTEGSDSPYDGTTQADAPTVAVISMEGEADWGDGASSSWGSVTWDAGSGGDDPYYTLTPASFLTGGSTYLIRVSNGTGNYGVIPDEGDFTLSWHAPPWATTGPWFSEDWPIVVAVGDTLTVDEGDWSGLAPITFDYQWMRCGVDREDCEPISGETGTSYETVSGDLEHTIAVAVTASNDDGNEEMWTDWGWVLDDTGAPTFLEGTPYPYVWGGYWVGDEQGITPAVFAGARPFTFSYQWQRCNAAGASCSNISGATDPTYTAASGDIGYTLRGVVTATNGSGSDSASASTLLVIGAAGSPYNYPWDPPHLFGTAEVGQVFSATAGGWAGDPVISFDYQWLRCDSGGEDCDEIEGATDSTYTLVEDDLGDTVRVRVTGTNGAGSQSATSAASAVVADGAPVNTVLPAITGLVQESQTLTAGHGSWAGSTPFSYSYQWRLCDSGGASCADISGETASTYAPVSADLGSTLRVAVTAENSVDQATAASDATVVVGSPQNTVAPVVSGVVQEGGELETTAGTWVGDGSVTLSYQWLRCDGGGGSCAPISGETGSTYTVDSADLDGTIRARVTGTNAYGSAEAVSEATDVVTAPQPPVNTVLPTVSGTRQQGQTLTAADGTWTGLPTITYAYQWQRCNAAGASCADISGETASTYLLDSDDTDNTVRVVVAASNVGGETDASSVPVLIGLPLNTTPPAISGTAQVGETVSVADGVWVAATPVSYTYQWRLCNSGGTSCADIVGATDPTYTASRTDQGSTLRAVVTSSNPVGDTSETTSATSTIANPAAPSSTDVPAIDGGTAVGGQLMASEGNWAGVTPMSFAYQWQRCNSAGASCSNIGGATSSAYTLVDDDETNTVRVVVSATNQGGSTSANSTVSAVISALPAPVNSDLPTAAGVAHVDDELQATDGDWENAPTSFAYQWRRCNSSGASCSNISSATAASYTLVAADAGSTIRVVVSATNAAGSTDATSDATAIVASLVADSPLGYWRLGETSSFADATGNGYSGSKTTCCSSSGASSTRTDGLPLWDDHAYVPIQVESGSGLTPNGAFVQIGQGSPNLLPSGTGSFSLEAWIKPVDDGGSYAGGVIGSYGMNGGGTANTGIGLLVDWPDLTPRFVRSGSGGSQTAAGTDPLPANQWSHLVGSYDGTTMKLYVNGVEVDSTASAVSADTLANVFIGKFDIDDAATYYPGYFDGSIDEAAIYDDDLTAGAIEAHYLNGRGIHPQPVSPASGATVTAEQVTLETTSLGSDISYRYQLTDDTDTSFASPLVDQTVVGASTYIVPEGTLAPGADYRWRLKATSPQGSASGWSTVRTFSYDPPRLGVRDYWPIFSHGPLAVNEVTGNLILTLPGPSFPTGGGDLSVSFVYNSSDSSDRFGLGAGWTMNTSGGNDSPTSVLIDRSQLTGSHRLASIARVSADGSVDEYGQLGETGSYVSAAADGAELSRNRNGSYTLVDPDGSIYSYGSANATTGIAQLTSAETSSAANGRAKVVYTYTSNKLTSVAIKDGTTVFATLTLNWSCSGALVCISGPDSVEWTFKGQSDATGKLATINDGSRDIWRVSYNPDGTPAAIRNANDLDATNPTISPSTLSTHAVRIGYDDSRVSSIADGPFRDRRYGTVTQRTSTWTLDYETPCSYTLDDPAHTHDLELPDAVGCTTITPPSQQGETTPKYTRVLWDGRSHPLEKVDVFGNYTLAAYNSRDQLEWTEDEDGNPTDYAYDPTNNTLTSVTGPDPDGEGALERPVTSYRYDETKIGTEEDPGPGLGGLRASYYPNSNLAGRPQLERLDANVDFDWSEGTPLDDPDDPYYSVRWKGQLVIDDTGDYTFTIHGESPQAWRLVLQDTDSRGNNVVAIDKPVGRGDTSSSIPIHLTAGNHPITVEYMHQGFELRKDPAGRTLASAHTGMHLLSEDPFYGIQLEWGCDSCEIDPGTVIPASAFVPAYLNTTSVLTPGATDEPSTRIAFSHYAQPETRLSDYSLIKVATDNLITSYSYDAFGHMTSKVMPKGNATRSINSSGDLTGSATSGYETSWDYYAAGATATPDCTGASSTNQAGLLQTFTRDGIAATETRYDAGGRPQSIANAAGTTCNSHDGEGRLIADKAPGESTATSYVYDPVGNQRLALNDTGILKTEYNEQAATLRTTDTFGAELETVYDKAGNPVQRRLAKGPLASQTVYTTSYAYDEADRLVAMTDPAERGYGFYYDSRGNLRATQYPNGTYSWTNINPAGWLTQLVNRHGTLETLPSTTPADTEDSPIADYAYTYWGNGQRKQETRTGDGLTTETTDYVYDSAGRLSQVTLPDSTVRDYSFDLDSNRIEIQDDSSTVATYTYDLGTTPGLDQLTSTTDGVTATSYGYTDDGQVSDQGDNTLAWDGRGRLTGGTYGATTLTYGFDPSGFRRQREATGATTTRYLLRGLLETNSSATITLTDVDGPAGDLAHYAGPPTTGSTVTYQYYNGHGDLAATADQAGDRAGAYTYDPYGTPDQTPVANTTTEQWTGRWDKKLDTTTGLIEMGARPYDPSVGRFLSPDPVEGGSANTYDYAGQDPANALDLDGRLVRREKRSENPLKKLLGESSLAMFGSLDGVREIGPKELVSSTFKYSIPSAQLVILAADVAANHRSGDSWRVAAGRAMLTNGFGMLGGAAYVSRCARFGDSPAALGCAVVMAPLGDKLGRSFGEGIGNKYLGKH